MAQGLYEKVMEAVAYLRGCTGAAPRFGIILGTGLSNLAAEIADAQIVEYEDIPHFPVSTVESHWGKLIFGQLGGQPVVAMAGRFHYYEGYSMEQVTFPVRVMKMLGVELLLISNAAGSVNPAMEEGDIVLLRDHINLLADNPLRGPNDPRFGPRFPDMVRTYSRTLNAHALSIAREHGIQAHEGVYVALQGPNLETPAEYVFMQRVGADLVGMSTVPEVLVARHMNLPVFVASVVSNKCWPVEEIRETTVEDVISLAREVEPSLRLIFTKVIETY
jgi:purine-nucleoside phosphorylase